MGAPGRAAWTPAGRDPLPAGLTLTLTDVVQMAADAGDVGFVARVAARIMRVLAHLVFIVAESRALRSPLIVGGSLFAGWLALFFGPAALPYIGIDGIAIAGIPIENLVSMLWAAAATIASLWMGQALAEGRYDQTTSDRLAQGAVFIALLPFLLYTWGHVVWLLANDPSWDFSFGFMETDAGFALSNYWPQDWVDDDGRDVSRWAYYRMGVLNTLRVVSVSIALCTIIGIVVGVLRMSSNRLVSLLAQTYVEIFRNVALVIQLIFWYTVLYLFGLPEIKNVLNVGGLDLIYISNRSILLPYWQVEHAWLAWVAFLVPVGVTGFHRWQDRDGVDDSPEGVRRRLLTWLGAITAVVVLLILALELDQPTITQNSNGFFTEQGGLLITPMFMAIMTGLTVYTSAQIAEIVRGSIQALPKGQIEAAVAIGLTPLQRTRLIVLPQALRSMIPAMTNQYLNLTKNSSLAIVVGYSEVYLITSSIVNNAGHAVAVFLLILLTYQVIGLFISGTMAQINRRVTRVRI